MLRAVISFDLICIPLQTDQGDVPVLLVGGGSALIDCSRSLRGASQVIRPQHFDVRQSRPCTPYRRTSSSLASFACEFPA